MLKGSLLIIKRILFIPAVLFFIATSAVGQNFRIYDKPVIFDSTRKKLSLEYLKVRHHIDANSASIKPVMIVLHWTAISTLEASFQTMNPSTLKGSRPDLVNASSLNVAAHFLIDRDGKIYRQLPDTAFARHTIGLNYCAIGVENVGSDKDLLTDAQLKANAELVRYLAKKYPIKYLIGHYEYKQFIHDPLWKEWDPNYLTQKTDPGTLFMARIREELKDLKLLGPPPPAAK